jgi:alkylated DNA repair dioxygenase AlkB
MTDAAPTVRWPGFRTHVLADGCLFLQGELPPELSIDDAGFEALWSEHPTEYAKILLHGRWVATPRWIRGYGTEYAFPGRPETPAEPVPPALAPVLRSAQEAIDPRLNAVHVNWYDAALGHYIGPHRDHRTGMFRGSPIVTISLGADRVFRLRPWRGKGSIDFAARHGTVFVIPYATNLRWMHEVPRLVRHRGRRISITVRALTGRP